MFYDNKIWIGESNGEKICIEPKMANRHGLIAGATGTGKTITLKVLAESFSDAGVPVFLADIKGDLSGMCRPGVDSEICRSVYKNSDWQSAALTTTITRQFFGIFTATWAFLPALQFLKWDRYCWQSLWTLTTLSQTF